MGTPRISPTTRLRPAPLRDPRFVVDVNLGRLAWLLRLLGFDVVWSSDADDETLVDISLAQRRILLTRDRALLKRRIITHGVFVHSDKPEEQTLEVIRRLDPRERLAPFSRCLRCNGHRMPASILSSNSSSMLGISLGPRAVRWWRSSRYRTTLLGVAGKIITPEARGYAVFAVPVTTGPDAGILYGLIALTGCQPAVHASANQRT